MPADLNGVIPILATPFRQDGSLDLVSQVRLASFLLEQGAHGLGVFGNAGEGYTLLADERREILRAVAKCAGGSVPLCVGVGATGTRLAVEACKEAEQYGAAALMVLPPYYLKPDPDGLVRFYAEISRAVDLPLMIQDAAMMSGVAMPPALLARIASEAQTVRYVKIESPPTVPKITQVMQAANGRLTLLGGLNGQFMIEEIQRGARGVMPASDMTALFVEIWDSLQAGDLRQAWSCFTRALPLIRYELQPGLGVAACKQNLAALGVIESAAVREPTRALDREGLAEIEHLRKLVYGRTGTPCESSPSKLTR